MSNCYNGYMGNNNTTVQVDMSEPGSVKQEEEKVPGALELLNAFDDFLFETNEVSIFIVLDIKSFLPILRNSFFLR